ncbi:response regulator [Phytoactinopolyspora alkaliphila]|uniref:Response regulator n=1 Tax=Phytoactinopolyspora alkaliphila TaxID=1783498 RepID=A0A6N9YHK5_9ACTN|nr:response regulator transcription factor [Phytoactinopolyspora alkaliphila]NED94410.1 response regulator [Phytoactinopolyspora alkaliphila]
MAGTPQRFPVESRTSAVDVLVVDDQETFLSVARVVVGATRGFQVVGEAKTGEDAVRQAASSCPGLVLMDINLPGISGIEATRRLLAACPATIVVLMSTYPASDLPPDARTCGAVAYVHKEDLTPDVLEAVMTGNQPPGWSPGDVGDHPEA